MGISVVYFQSLQTILPFQIHLRNLWGLSYAASLHRILTNLHQTLLSKAVGVSFLSYHISTLLIRMLLVGQKLLKTWDVIIFWNWTPVRNEGNKNVTGDALSVLGKVWNKCSPTQKSCPSSNGALAWRNILQIMWQMLIANIVDTHKLINLYWKVDHCWERQDIKPQLCF